MWSESAAAWRVSLTVPAPAQDLFEAALQQLKGAILAEPPKAGMLRLEAYCATPPDRARLVAGLSAAAASAGVDVPTPEVESLTAADWVAESQRALPPVRAGCFYICGSHIADPPPAGAIAIRIDAGLAFGTGLHESTRGCLHALTGLVKRRRVRRALDMGCGSGILAIAAAKLWACPVVAVDNDRCAVQVARENGRKNGVAALVAAAYGNGYRSDAAARLAPYDLIVANILAAPLCAMARDLKRSLNPGGVAVLSGLLASEQARVLARHRAQGFRLEQRICLDKWVTLVLAG